MPKQPSGSMSLCQMVTGYNMRNLRMKALKKADESRIPVAQMSRRKNPSITMSQNQATNQCLPTAQMCMQRIYARSTVTYRKN